MALAVALAATAVNVVVATASGLFVRRSRIDVAAAYRAIATCARHLAETGWPSERVYWRGVAESMEREQARCERMARPFRLKGQA